MLRAQPRRTPARDDLFGKRGRAWLATLELPGDERQTLDAACAKSTSSTQEIAALDQSIADLALDSTEIKRLMTIPGIDITTAATLHGRDRRHQPLSQRRRS